MTSYKTISTSKQFISLMKNLDFPSTANVEELLIPKMKFVTVIGKGEPGSQIFQSAIQSLYGIAFTLKMGLKFGKVAKPKQYYDFKVAPLEGLWWQDKGKLFDMEDKDNWQWQLMIMMPDFVDQKLFDQARAQAQAKHPEIPYANVNLEEFEEGLSIQITHIGPYAEEADTVKKLMDYAKRHEYKIAGKHHEIYMGDPRRTAPEKLKTAIRYAVKKVHNIEHK